MTVQKYLNKSISIFFEISIFLLLVAIFLIPFILLSLPGAPKIFSYEPTTAIVFGIIVLCIILATIVHVTFKKQMGSISRKLTDELLS